MINPLDLTRFFFEGRSEARLPVAMARARVFLPQSTSLEVLALPDFRPGRFDQLDEPTSPFNVLAAVCSGAGPGGSRGPTPVICRRQEPAVRWGNMQAGARLQTTTGQVDWGISAFRGFETFGALTAGRDGALEETYSRFTMIGGDFETVRGEWGLRGEVAWFDGDSFQSPTLASPSSGRTIDAGAGVDRRAGDFRVSGNLVVRHRSLDDPAAAPDFDRSDVNLIASVDRAFGRETRRVQVFGVYDPTEGTSFLRSILTVSLTDQFSLEVSGGAFLGEGRDTLGRFADRDFAYLRIRRAF